MDASERYEQLIAYLSTHLPSPVEQEELDGFLIMTGGSPGGGICRSACVRETRTMATTPHTARSSEP